MELHTLGVRSGYTQSRRHRVRARADRLERRRRRGRATTAMPTTSLFRPNLHEPGSRTILGKTYAQPGDEQARAVLVDFARAPATATHVATKLARHFAGDTPPPALVVAAGGQLHEQPRRSAGALPHADR